MAEGLLDDGVLVDQSEDGHAHMAFLRTLEPKLQAAVRKEAMDAVLASDSLMKCGWNKGILRYPFISLSNYVQMHLRLLVYYAIRQ